MKKFLSWIAYRIITLYCMTWRIKYVNNEYYDKCRAENKGLVGALWHDQLLPIAFSERKKKIGTIASQSKDGELITNLLILWGFTVARGSSTRGCARALLGGKKILEQGTHLVITVDGPTGPRHEVKPGAIYASRLANTEIVGIFTRFKRYIRFNSWDKFLLPLPFSRIEVIYTDPVKFDPDADDEINRQILENTMLDVTREITPDFV